MHCVMSGMGCALMINKVGQGPSGGGGRGAALLKEVKISKEVTFEPNPDW